MLPENRQERMAILLKNLPNEDLVHIENSRIPAFLRIDKDVQHQREKLNGYQEQYMQFNINDYSHQVKDGMATRINEVSREFQDHRRQTDN